MSRHDRQGQCPHANGFNYFPCVLKDFAVPKTHDVKSSFPQPLVTLFVVEGFGMLSSIRFHDEFPFQAHKIRHVRP
jgi:hypothetical protein